MAFIEARTYVLLRDLGLALIHPEHLSSHIAEHYNITERQQYDGDVYGKTRCIQLITDVYIAVVCLLRMVEVLGWCRWRNGDDGENA